MNKSSSYLEAQILTAPREKLLLMLFDGVLGYCYRAKTAWESKEGQDIEAYHQALIRAQRVILELKMSLNQNMEQKIYNGLQALYAFVYRRLVEANVEKNLTYLDEATTIVSQIKEMFEEDLKRVQEELPKPVASISPKEGERISSLFSLPTVNLQG